MPASRYMQALPRCGTWKTKARNADGLIALTKRGLPPLEAIRAATLNAAELMSCQDRVGALDAGKYADLIAVPTSQCCSR
jgi:imidazolonepropionase-like amidohydrolase